MALKISLTRHRHVATDRRRLARTRVLARLRPLFLRAARMNMAAPFSLTARERSLVTQADLYGLQQWATYAANPGLIYVSGRIGSGKAHIRRTMAAAGEGGR